MYLKKHVARGVHVPGVPVRVFRGGGKRPRQTLRGVRARTVLARAGGTPLHLTALAGKTSRVPALRLGGRRAPAPARARAARLLRLRHPLPWAQDASCVRVETSSAVAHGVRQGVLHAGDTREMAGDGAARGQGHPFRNVTGANSRRVFEVLRPVEPKVPPNRTSRKHTLASGRRGAKRVFCFTPARREVRRRVQELSARESRAGYY